MEGLRRENERLKQENRELRELLKQVTERLIVAEEKIKQLSEQLKQNSRNSSWPSSHDTHRLKPKPKSLRSKTGRKVGGQEGHEGHTLVFNPKPDVVTKHRPAYCEHCQIVLPAEIEASGVTKRQVFDVPSLHFVTTEHQAEAVPCPGCGGVTSGTFPLDVTHLVQYGSQVKRLTVYLRHEQFIPYERERQMLADLFALPISTGSLQNFVETAAVKVEPVTEAIKEALMQADVAHADETGFYINGQRVWLHTASTDALTHYEPHAQRGQKATDAIGILPQFTGTLVHDAWPAYFKYCLLSHALCNAHHLRDLTALVENEQQPWAALMIACLLAAKQQVAEAYAVGQTALSADCLERIHQLYDAIVELGLAENPLADSHPPPGKRGRPKKTKSRNLVERFDQHKTAILRFVHDFKVPFDNNLAERDIRMMKVQQKVSGCFRSWDGARQFCRLRSYISTIRKQGLNVWEAFGSLFEGEVLVPQLTPA
ncbi:MAG: IS66 family transposase [Candidatus Promineifilaceae bacterium]